MKRVVYAVLHVVIQNVKFMQQGSLVEAVADFTSVKRDWPFIEFPNKGDILTVKSVTLHPHKSMRKIGAVMLTFEELNNEWGISDRTYKNEPNFIELQPPMKIDIEEIILESITI